jgi:hypothetical protein
MYCVMVALLNVGGHFPPLIPATNGPGPNRQVDTDFLLAVLSMPLSRAGPFLTTLSGVDDRPARGTRTETGSRTDAAYDLYVAEGLDRLVRFVIPHGYGGFCLSTQRGTRI